MFRSPEPKQRAIDDLAIELYAQHTGWTLRKAKAVARLRLSTQTINTSDENGYN